jgi:hypothetical protein
MLSSTRLAAMLTVKLPPSQKRLHSLAFVVLALLSADTLFLLAHRGLRQFGEGRDWGRSATALYQASVFLHSIIGYALAALLVVFLARHLPAVLMRLRRRWWLLASGIVIVGGYGFLAYSGTYFFLHSKKPDTDWLYWSHMGVGGGFLLLYVVHLLFGAGALPRRPTFGLLGAAAAMAALLLVVEQAGRLATETPPVAPPALASAADANGFAPYSGMNTARPFFPSPVAMASGAAQIDTAAIIGQSEPDLAEKVREEVQKIGYARTRLIGAEGCARCHADTVKQWSSSAHRFSSFNNPFYFASVDPLRKLDGHDNAFVEQHLKQYGFQGVKTGQIRSQWCAGCHDPALLFDGKMRVDVDRGDYKAQAGLTCLACHQMKDVPNHNGSGGYVWDDTFRDKYLFADSNAGIMSEIHDLYLKANPEQHKADMLKPVFRTGQYCSTCHKVSLEKPLNQYRYVRGQDEYDNWHDSGMTWSAARTFYQPKQPVQCQTCHMPLVDAPLGDLAAKAGKIKSHYFTAVNTALPFIRGDKEMLARTEEFMRTGKVRISIAGLRSGDRIATTTEAADATLDIGADHKPELNVVVRNLGVGHTFPGGTNDSNEGWIEITVQDQDGRPLMRAGGVDAEKRVVQNTRIYNAVFVDRFSNRIERRNAQDISALVYAAVIPPSSSDTARFCIPLDGIPAEVGKVKVTARVLWRKFNRTFSEFVRGAEPREFAETGADLPITEMAAASGTLAIDRRAGGATLALHADNPGVPAEQRYLVTHDYGVGLLLQGDTVIARKVMEDLVARHPECPNCTRTLARVYLIDRDYAAARKVLDQHEQRWPNDAQGAWLWADLLRAEGKDDDAIKALKRVAEIYPRDREAWRVMQELDYRDGRFAEAVDASGHVIDIDPEDATAHYYAMLARRAMGDEAGAKFEESAYRYYQRDESAQQMTLNFRKRDDAVNFASQMIRVYELR